MNRKGSVVIIIGIIILIILAIGIGFYFLVKNKNQITPLPTQANSSTTPQNSITIPRDALTSPDQKWIAFETAPTVSFGTGFEATIAEVDITNPDQSVIKTFAPTQLYAAPSCGCTIQIMGWGNGILWLDNESSDDGLIDSFLKIDTTDWSVTNYPTPTNTFDNPALSWFWNGAIDLNTGRFVITNLPWTPNSDGENPAQDPNIYSVSIYDIQTGTSQIIETTTAETAAPMQTTFGSDLKWINDNTLQYYNFHLGALATTTVSD